MHQAAPTGGLPDDVFDSMKALARLGYHVFPAAHQSKTPWPGLPWKRFAESLITDDLVDQLRGLPKTPNIALICSEHLVVIDIDNLSFGAWFEAQGPERLGTWVVQTPSGGLHVYVRSSASISTTVLKTRGGLKVGDLKAEGGYVICPPSVGSNGEYETAYGAPNQLIHVDDAKEWFIRSFIDAYEGTLPVRIDTVTRAGDEYADVRVQDAPPVEDQQALHSLLHSARLANQLSDYVYVTLTEGPDAPLARDHWKNADDHSGVDFGCVKELINLGWTFQQVEQWWTFAPIGEMRYRNAKKSHGHGYLLRTFDNAKKQWDAEQINLKNMVGGNFKVVEPIERWTVDNEVRLRFKLQSTTRPGNPTYAIECRGFDFTPRRFKDVCLKAGLYVDLGNFDTEAKLGTLYDLVMDTAVDIALPDAATREGQIRDSMVQYVTINMAAYTPEDGKPFAPRVWRKLGFVYVQPYPMTSYLGERLRPHATGGEVWQQWVSIQGGSTPEGLWRAPVASFPGLAS
jgi:hypothetical protein